MDITIKLIEPITGHEGPITEITLREPSYGEIMKFGEPYAQGFSRDGSVVYQAENTDAIRGYIEALVKPPVDALLIRQLKTANSLRLKDAVLGFFQDARSRLSASTQTSSSSTLK